MKACCCRYHLQLACFNVPDVVNILADASVGREEAHARDGLRDALEPPLLVLPGVVDFLHAVDVQREVVGEAVPVVAAGERLDELRDLLLRAELALAHGADDVVQPLVDHRRTALAQRGDLLGARAEDERVLDADVLDDLDVGAVVGAHEQPAVEDELHVGRAGRLRARGGDVLRDVVARDDDLRHRDAVVGQEDDLQQVADAAVVVDDLGDVVDELDDLLRRVVARRRLAGDDAHLGDDVLALGVAQALDPEVAVDDAEDVEELALVLVDALHLHVEHRVGVDLDVGVRLLDERGEAELVLVLGVGELLEEARRDVLAQDLQLGQVDHPRLVADDVGDDVRERRVALAQPAARRHAVGDVDELLGPDLEEVPEDVGLDDLGVDLGDAVDLVRADDGEVRHADALLRALLDDGEPRDLVAGEPLARERLEEARVDLEDDLHVAREEVGHHVDGPRLERLGQDGVVRERERLGDEAPRGVPVEPLLVDEDVHQLRDRDVRVRVVQLDAGGLREVLPRARGLLEAADDVLDGRGREEVLLLQPQLLPLGRVRVRVQHLADALVLLALGEHAPVVVVVLVVEVLEVELCRRRRGPQAEVVRVDRVEAGDGRVVGDGDHRVRALPAVLDLLLLALAARGDDLGHVPAKVDLEADVAPADLPRVALVEPEVGRLDLCVVDDVLLEHPVQVADAVAPRGVVERGERVEEARREPPEPAVAERRVLLLLEEVLETVPEARDRLGVLLAQAEVGDGVVQGAPHQILDGEVVDALDVVVGVVHLRVVPVLDHPVAQRVRRRLVRRERVDVVHGACERVLQVAHDLLHDAVDVLGRVCRQEVVQLLLLGGLAALELVQDGERLDLPALRLLVRHRVRVRDGCGRARRGERRDRDVTLCGLRRLETWGFGGVAFVVHGAAKGTNVPRMGADVSRESVVHVSRDGKNRKQKTENRKQKAENRKQKMLSFSYCEKEQIRYMDVKSGGWKKEGEYSVKRWS